MSEAKDDPFVIDDALDAKIREAERRAREEGRRDDPILEKYGFKVTEARAGVNPIMKRELGGTTLCRDYLGIPADPMDRLLGQIAGLIPPDAEPAMERARAVEDPEVMRWTASAEDLAWIDRAFSPNIPHGAVAAPSSAKAQLLYWYLETLLPKIAAKGTIFAVLITLLKASPDDCPASRCRTGSWRGRRGSTYDESLTRSDSWRSWASSTS